MSIIEIANLCHELRTYIYVLLLILAMLSMLFLED